MNMYHRVHYNIVHEVRYNIVLLAILYDIVLNHTIRYCTTSYNKILYLTTYLEQYDTI